MTDPDEFGYAGVAPGDRHAGTEESSIPDPEYCCIECGKSESGMCGCCGAPLCSMHMETQAGFCSDFTTHSFSEGTVVEVEDSIKDLRRAKIRFTEDVEVSGCLLEADYTETDLFFPMDNLQEGADEPVSELDMDKLEVVE